jgi:RimJ/RimL family protein N-acetyltransferase
LHGICSDPLVMATIGKVHDLEATRALLDRLMARAERDGHTFWALERKSDGRMIGFCGLATGTVPHIENEIEIGWRLGEPFWGQGYAREAALASLRWAWSNLSAPRVIAITVPANRRSWGLMERIGMIRMPELDFGHPGFPDNHPLHRHITYAVDRPGTF